MWCTLKNCINESTGDGAHKREDEHTRNAYNHIGHLTDDQLDQLRDSSNLQNVNPPARIPFATAIGNNLYMSMVNGNCRTANIIGGKTNLNLETNIVNECE